VPPVVTAVVVVVVIVIIIIIVVAAAVLNASNSSSTELNATAPNSCLTAEHGLTQRAPDIQKFTAMKACGLPLNRVN